MSGADPLTPPGWQRVVPRMIVPDAAGLVAFVKQVFDAEGELPVGAPAEMKIGDTMVMISGSGERDAAPAFLYVYVEDADAVYERAIAAGATSLEAPADMPYGDRRGMVRDAWGNTWQIARYGAAPT